MKKELTLGTPSVPVLRLSTGRIRELLNRVLPRECEMKKSAGMFGGLGKIAHLCSDFHLIQATDVRQLLPVGLFHGHPATQIVPTPVRSVNAPAACIRWKSTGKRYFFCTLPVFNQFIVSFLIDFQK